MCDQKHALVLQIYSKKEECISKFLGVRYNCEVGILEIRDEARKKKLMGSCIWQWVHRSINVRVSTKLMKDFQISLGSTDINANKAAPSLITPRGALNLGKLPLHLRSDLSVLTPGRII